MDYPHNFSFRCDGFHPLGGKERQNTRELGSVPSHRPSHMVYTLRSRLCPYPNIPPLSPKVHLGRGPFAKSLMRSLGVVEPEIPAQPPAHLCTVGVIPQIDVFVLHRASQSLHHYVVQRSSSAIHTDLHPDPLQAPREIGRASCRERV